MARQRQTDINSMIRHGIPRVMVDNGHINSKLFFQITSAAGNTTSASSGESLPRLTVRPVNIERPEETRMTVNMVGEVDITFKTVSI